mgnify:CR=1 FL=1
MEPMTADEALSLGLAAVRAAPGEGETAATVRLRQARRRPGKQSHAGDEQGQGG